MPIEDNRAHQPAGDQGLFLELKAVEVVNVLYQAQRLRDGFQRFNR